MFDNLYLGADIPIGVGKYINAVQLKRRNQDLSSFFSYSEYVSACGIARSAEGVRTGSHIILNMENM